MKVRVLPIRRADLPQNPSELDEYLVHHVRSDALGQDVLDYPICIDRLATNAPGSSQLSFGDFVVRQGILEFSVSRFPPPTKEMLEQPRFAWKVALRVG